jgi:hypothetical protein
MSGKLECEECGDLDAHQIRSNLGEDRKLCVPCYFVWCSEREEREPTGLLPAALGLLCAVVFVLVLRGC